MWEWIADNGTAIGALVAALTFMVSSVKYFFDRRDAVRQRRFENYHKLIDELVEGRRPGQVTRLDSQIAVVYELRSYTEYREVTIRILQGVREGWVEAANAPRLIGEIDLTLSFLGVPTEGSGI